MVAPSRAEAAALLLALDSRPWHVRHSRAVAEVAAFLALCVARRGLDRLRSADVGPDRDGKPRSPLASAAAWDPRATGNLEKTLVDRAAVEAAALLHDADKALPPSDEIRRLRHGEGSAEWLARNGHAELGPLVAAHPVTRLADEAWFREVLLPAPIEVRIVAYADKRAGQHLEPMAERFASWERRYPPARPRSAGDKPTGLVGEEPEAGARSGRASWDRATMNAVRERALELEASVCNAAGIAPHDVRRLRWTANALAEAMGGPPSAGRPAKPASPRLVSSLPSSAPRGRSSR